MEKMITTLKGQRFNFRGDEILIREREKPIPTKYFLWNLTQKKYLSSLFATDRINIYSCDFKNNNGQREFMRFYALQLTATTGLIQ